MQILKRNTKLGFTLIEIVVSLTIISIIMMVVLFKYATSGDTFSVASAGQEIAIAIRQSQAYGLSVREAPSSVGQFTYAYGVFVDTTTPTNIGNYLIFVDRDGDRFYDPGTGNCGAATTECVERFSLRDGVRFASLQTSGGGTVSGSPTGVHITFLRPSTDATVKFTNSAGSQLAAVNSTKINLSSPKGKTYSVTVETNGQILAQ